MNVDRLCVPSLRRWFGHREPYAEGGKLDAQTRIATRAFAFSLLLVLAQLAARYIASGILTRYYTPEVHRAAFVLPRYVAEMRDAAPAP
jgi:spermidine synthase